MTGSLRCVALLAILSFLLPGVSQAAEAKDYASVFMQGRITDGLPGRPLVGATVRLTHVDQVYESVTDARGAFVFERLPIASFRLDIVTLDGGVLRGLRELDPTDPEQQRIEIVLGDEPSGRRSARSPDRLIVVPLADQRLTLVGPAKARETDQLRRQALIFLGAALLLGL